MCGGKPETAEPANVPRIAVEGLNGPRIPLGSVGARTTRAPDAAASSAETKVRAAIAELRLPAAFGGACQLLLPPTKREVREDDEVREDEVKVRAPPPETNVFDP